MITVIIPAVTEPGIGATIASIRAQTVDVDRIIVALNNTSDPDATALPALAAGAEVINHGTCPGRKAEAINRTLATLPRTGLVLVMDADTVLSPGFIASALAELEDPAVGGVGAVFGGVAPTNYIELCTFLEWARYEEQIDRTKKTFVLSGTAALIRWEALETVRERFGQWYNTDTITEDNFLTLALKTCGWELRSPIECRATTQMMSTVPTLFRQRRRWSRGAIENVLALGVNRVTRPYVVQQVMLLVSIVMLWSLIGLTIAAAIMLGGLAAPQPLWALVGVIFAAERVATVWGLPWRYRLFAALVLPELAYALVVQAAHVAAIGQLLFKKEGVWAHVTPKAV